MKRNQFSGNLEMQGVAIHDKRRKQVCFNRQEDLSPNACYEHTFRKKKNNHVEIGDPLNPADKKCLFASSINLSKNLNDGENNFDINIESRKQERKHRRVISGKVELISSQNEKPMKEESYRDIIKVMEQENSNLKQQNNYLLKALTKERKKYQNQLSLLERKVFQLSKENQLFKKHLQILQVFYPPESQSNQKLSFPSQQLPTSASDTAADTAQIISQDLKELNEKFEYVYNEYRQTKKPELKKSCVDLAKRIKQLKASKDERDFEKRKQSQHHRRTYTGEPFIRKM